MATEPDMSPLRGTIPSWSTSEEGTPVLVLLVEYRDIHFTIENPREYFDRIFNTGEDHPDGVSGNIARYFERQSGGLFRPVFDVTDPVRLTATRMSYGSNNTSGEDKYPENMLVQASGLIDGSVDFSRYDTDGDGYVDNIVIIYAGQDETTSGVTSAVNPHRGKLSDKNKSTTKDNVILDSYVCIAELEADRSLGQGPLLKLLCRELGLPLLGHSTNAGAGFTPGPWSLMDRGDRAEDGDKPVGLSVCERVMLGWIAVQPMPKNGKVTLGSTTSYYIPTERKQEYFLIENRRQHGQDTFLPGQGMLIWHVDMSGVQAISEGVNDIASHQYIDIVEACGEANVHMPELLESYAWPSGEHDSFDAISWGGLSTGYSLSGIVENTDGSVSFMVNGEIPVLTTPDAPTVEGRSNGTAMLSWTPCAGADRYLINIIDEDESEEDILESNTNSLTVIGLTAGVNYSASVCSVAGQEQSEWSEKTYFILPEPCWADMYPEAETETDFEDQGFTARWSHLDGAEAYLLSVVGNFGRGEESCILEFGHSGSKELQLPATWEWTGEASDVYLTNSYGYYGTNAPALKFDSSDMSLTSPAEEGLYVTGISFWMRGATGADESILRIEGISLGKNEVLARLTPPISQGAIFEFRDFPAQTERVRLVYEKVGGNLALDDLRLETIHVTEKAVEDYTDKNVGFCDNHRVELAHPIAHSYSFYVTALDSEGNRSGTSMAGKVIVPQGAGIFSPSRDTAGVEVFGNTILYSGVSGDVLRVYTADGILRSQAVVNFDGVATIGLPAGFYIAVTPEGSTKIRVN